MSSHIHKSKSCLKLTPDEAGLVRSSTQACETFPRESPRPKRETCQLQILPTVLSHHDILAKLAFNTKLPLQGFTQSNIDSDKWLQIPSEFHTDNLSLKDNPTTFDRCGSGGPTTRVCRSRDRRWSWTSGFLCFRIPETSTRAPEYHI